jgi:hypothetical protein
MSNTEQRSETGRRGFLLAATPLLSQAHGQAAPPGAGTATPDAARPRSC